MESPNIGEKPGPGARRDAIHIAVIPVVALGDFVPGTRVGLSKQDGKAVLDKQGNYQATTLAEPTVGIVDPFLDRPVKRGELFWLFLLPGTITSLRHQWTCPAFSVRTLEDLRNGK